MNSLINHGLPFHFKHRFGLGLTEDDIRNASMDGQIRRLVHGVYVDSRSPDTRALRISAAKLCVPPHAVICDETAAWLLGVDTWAPNDRHALAPQFVVPHGSSRVRKQQAPCRQAKIRDDDLTELDGILVTNPIRTTSDLLRKQWRPNAMASADAMAHAGLVVPSELQQYLRRLRGHRGIRQARDLSYLIEPKATTAGESWQRLRLIDAGFPRPQAQVPVHDVEGNLRYLDSYYEESKVAPEFDGREHHTASEHRDHDDRRRLLLEARGIRFVVARTEDLFGSDNSFELRIGELLGLTAAPRWW